MNLSKYDGMMFVYNYAVVVTGLYVAHGFAGRIHPVELVVGAVVALVWTAYFRLSLLSRFGDHPALAREDGPESRTVE